MGPEKLYRDYAQLLPTYPSLANKTVNLATDNRSSSR